MKTYHLNLVIADNDSLVSSYGSLKRLRAQWKNDVRDFLEDNGVKDDTDVSWYPYFTCEDNGGDIRELSSGEVFGGAA